MFPCTVNFLTIGDSSVVGQATRFNLRVSTPQKNENDDNSSQLNRKKLLLEYENSMVIQTLRLEFLYIFRELERAY